MSQHKKNERGQALILITFGIIALVGVTALAVDGGNAYSDRRQAQNAADSAALAAALAEIRESDFEQAGLDVAEENGYDDAVDEISVDVLKCTDANSDCGPYDGDDEYIQVMISSTVDTYFGMIVGTEQITSNVDAIAHAVDGTNTQFFGGNGLVALAPSGNDVCHLNSNAEIRIVGDGAWCNSNGSRALALESNSDYYTDDGICVVGGYNINGNGEIHGDATTGCTAYEYPPDLSMIPDPPSPPTCSGNGYQNGNTLYPGNWNNILLGTNGTYTMTSGVYCIQNGFTVQSNVEVYGGDIILVIGNSNVIFSSNGDINFDSLEIYSQNGSLTLNSNQELYPDRFRFYATGTGNIMMNSNGSLESEDTFIYCAENPFHLNSNFDFKITAPTTGPYAGLAVYFPLTNDSYFTLDSNSTMEINGTFLAPAIRMTLNSNSGLNQINSQIIAYSYIINSNSNLVIDMDGAPQYGPSSDPYIELVK